MLIRPVFEKVKGIAEESAQMFKTVSPSLKVVLDLIMSVINYVENRPKSPKKSKASPEPHFSREHNNNHDLHDLVDSLIS
jgi:hypothetical protein